MGPEAAGQPDRSTVGTDSGRNVGVVIGAVSAVALLVVGAILVAAGMLAGRDGPEITARAFFEAVRTGDCDRMVDLVELPAETPAGELGAGLCADLTDAAEGERGAELAEARLRNAEVVERADDSATVELVVAGRDGEETRTPLAMTMVDGEWKVDFSGRR